MRVAGKSGFSAVVVRLSFFEGGVCAVFAHMADRLFEVVPATFLSLKGGLLAMARLGLTMTSETSLHTTLGTFHTWRSGLPGPNNFPSRVSLSGFKA